LGYNRTKTLDIPMRRLIPFCLIMFALGCAEDKDGTASTEDNTGTADGADGSDGEDGGAL
jgi:hypothetical protein